MLLDQLAGFGWQVIDVSDMKQTPADTHLESYTNTAMPLVLREPRKVINWHEANQVEERGKQIAVESRVTSLLESGRVTLIKV